MGHLAKAVSTIHLRRMPVSPALHGTNRIDGRFEKTAIPRFAGFIPYEAVFTAPYGKQDVANRVNLCTSSFPSLLPGTVSPGNFYRLLPEELCA